MAHSPKLVPAALFGHTDLVNRPTPNQGFSVVTPMYREEGGAVRHVQEIAAALQQVGPIDHEIIVVDDGSDDQTAVTLEAARDGGLDFRLIRHRDNAGQSRAIRTGVLAAHYPVIVMIDGDGQNDPADIPRLLALLTVQSQDGSLPMLAMVAGERQRRQDTGAKKFASKIANQVRQALLNDGARDSGCGLKIFYRAAFLQLPYFDHIHRYLPFLMKREGYRVVFAPVGHRARAHGASKYTNLGRLGVAFRDLAGVLWLKARFRSPGDISER